MGFVPENELERSLMRAAADPAHRPQFYRDLVRSQIFLVSDRPLPAAMTGSVTLSEATELQIRNIEHEGVAYVPIFSSVLRLRMTITEDVTSIGTNAGEFLKITRGSALWLNPGSDYGKVITAEEAASIVDGTIWQPAERHVIPSGSQIQIGPPTGAPEELVGALERFFKTKMEVRRAWLADIQEHRETSPHLVIGLEVTGSFDAIAAEVGIVVGQLEIPRQPFDLVQVTGKGALDSCFLNRLRPFYRRRFLGIF